VIHFCGTGHVRSHGEVAESLRVFFGIVAAALTFRSGSFSASILPMGWFTRLTHSHLGRNEVADPQQEYLDRSIGHCSTRLDNLADAHHSSLHLDGKGCSHPRCSSP